MKSRTLPKTIIRRNTKIIYSKRGMWDLDDIYSKIKGHPKTETNPTWRDTVRRTLQQYSIFYQEERGSGIWYLREEKPFGEFDPKKNPNPGHEDVQGMLLQPGKIYGNETWKKLTTLIASENLI